MPDVRLSPLLSIAERVLVRPDIDQLVSSSSPELNLRRIGWIFEAREQMLEFNVPVALALESLMVSLKAPSR